MTLVKASRRCGLNSHAKRRKRNLLWARDGGLCWICLQPFSKKKPPTIDHVVELRDGGSDALSNLRLAHRKCNNFRSNSRATYLRPVPVAALDIACSTQDNVERCA